MTNLIKTVSAASLVIALTACATANNDKYSVGVDDNDGYVSTADNTDTKLSDAQTFGVNDDDDFEAMTMEDSMDSKTAMSDEAEMMKPPMVGNAPMFPNKTIVENASQADNLTTLVSLVKLAELVETLSGEGPFTVFAPTDNAFSLVPSETVTFLTQPENKEQLQKVLTAHVISGTITSSDLMAALSNAPSYSAQTVSGDTLTFYKMGDAIRVADENGTLAKISTADVMQSNGVVHVVNSVLVPK